MKRESEFKPNISEEDSEEQVEWIIGTNEEYKNDGLKGKLPDGVTEYMVNIYVRKDGRIGAALKPEFIKDPELRFKASKYHYINQEREMWP